MKKGNLSHEVTRMNTGEKTDEWNNMGSPRTATTADYFICVYLS